MNPSYNILDDEKYDDVFMDLESPEEKEKEINSVQMSLVNIYDNQNISETEDDPVLNKFQLELEALKMDERNSFINDSSLSVLSCSSSIPSESEFSASAAFSQSNPKYTTSGFKKLTYEDVNNSLNKHFTKEFRIASELDILLTYLKGQQHIFLLSNRMTLLKFYILMFPAIFITGSIAMIGPFFNTVQWSGWVLSSLNAFLTVLIAINNFMKWQATAEVFLNISNQFEHLSISVEMSRNQFFIDDETERNRLIYDKLRDTETRIMDIKFNVKNMVIPSQVRVHNPIITHINIFSFIQKIENHQKQLVLKYKDIKNEIRFIMYKWEKENVQQNKKQSEIRRLEHLLKEKEGLKGEILLNNSNHVYSYIDSLFTREIQNSEKYYGSYGLSICMGLSTPENIVLSELNGKNNLVDDYLRLIFSQPMVDEGPVLK